MGSHSSTATKADLTFIVSCCRPCGRGAFVCSITSGQFRNSPPWNGARFLRVASGSIILPTATQKTTSRIAWPARWSCCRRRHHPQKIGWSLCVAKSKEPASRSTTSERQIQAGGSVSATGERDERRKQYGEYRAAFQNIRGASARRGRDSEALRRRHCKSLREFPAGPRGHRR